MKSVEILRPYARNSGFPIDVFSVFASYDEAVEYAHNNPAAYATQIIGIDDKNNRQSAIYKLAYDKNKNYRFILEKIEIGNGASVFKFRGSVPTKDDLPKSNVINGDMYLIDETNEMVVAYVDSNQNIEWKTITVSIQTVSKTNDGIMSKELYKTLYNESGSDAVYFSRNVTEDDGDPDTPIQPQPQQNSWIRIDHTVRETDTEYKLPSVGMVKKLINGLLEQTNPRVEIIAVDDYDRIIPSENSLGTIIKPILKIVFNREFGGKLNEAAIYRVVEGFEPVEIFKGKPVDNDLDENDKIYAWSFTDPEPLTLTSKGSVIYKVIVSYDESETGDLDAGICSDEIKFNFYPTIIFGHNLQTYNPVFLKGKTEIKLNFDPSNYEENINEIFIKIPSIASLDAVEYVPQNDKFALSLFDLTESNDDIKLYKYSLTGSMHFRSPVEFIFHINEL